MIRAPIMGTGCMLLVLEMTQGRIGNSIQTDKQTCTTPKERTNNYGTMRCWNLTYNDPGRWAEVHAISGKPLSFIAGIKAGGTGSPRGTLLHLPTELIGMLKETSNADYCNIQRTSDGGILFFKVRLELYGVPINHSDLSFVRSELQADGTGVFTRSI